MRHHLPRMLLAPIGKESCNLRLTGKFYCLTRQGNPFAQDKPQAFDVIAPFPAGVVFRAVDDGRQKCSPITVHMAQVEGFSELLGVSSIKPFECVGEIGECRAAFSRLSGSPDWRNDAVIRTLADDVPEESLAPWLAGSPDHMIPDEFNACRLA